MNLVTWHQINTEFFRKGSRIPKKTWEKAVCDGKVHGKILLGQVYIDLDDFVTRTEFDTTQPAANDEQTIAQKASALME